MNNKGLQIVFYLKAQKNFSANLDAISPKNVLNSLAISLGSTSDLPSLLTSL